MITHALAMLLLSFQAAPPVIAPADVLPADSKPTYRTHFSATCQEWSAARRGTSEESRLRVGIYRLWVLGYITGFNVVGPDKSGDLLGTAPQDEVYRAIDGYCARNPTYHLVDAMRPIAAAFVRRRQSKPVANVPASKTHAQAVALVTCRDWSQNQKNAILRLAYAGVVGGYITAYNRFGPDATGDAIGAADHPLIEEALGKYCSSHPTALLIGAVTPLIEHVAAERAAGRLPPAGMRPHDKVTPGSGPDPRPIDKGQPAAC